jgi:hypothetical protein
VPPVRPKACRLAPGSLAEMLPKVAMGAFSCVGNDSTANSTSLDRWLAALS